MNGSLSVRKKEYFMESFYNRLILRNKFYCKIWETFILLRDRQDYNSDIHTCDKLDQGR